MMISQGKDEIQSKNLRPESQIAPKQGYSEGVFYSDNHDYHWWLTNARNIVYSSFLMCSCTGSSLSSVWAPRKSNFVIILMFPLTDQGDFKRSVLTTITFWVFFSGKKTQNFLSSILLIFSEVFGKKMKRSNPGSFLQIRSGKIRNIPSKWVKLRQKREISMKFC